MLLTVTLLAVFLVFSLTCNDVACKSRLACLSASSVTVTVA